MIEVDPIRIDLPVDDGQYDIVLSFNGEVAFYLHLNNLPIGDQNPDNEVTSELVVRPMPINGGHGEIVTAYLRTEGAPTKIEPSPIAN